MQRHDPDLTARIRIIEATGAAPIPFLVASRHCPDDVVTSLQTALMEFGEIARMSVARRSRLGVPTRIRDSSRAGPDV